MEGHSEFWTIFGHAIKITDALLVIFTFFLFLATALLWWSTRNLVRETGAHGQRALRAYVSVVSGGIQVVNLTQGGQGIAIHVELKNSGQTPGYDFTAWMKQPRILPATDTPFDQPTPVDQRAGTSIIGPGGSTHINWTMAATPAELADIQAGTKRVFVWGGANYSDIFGKKRAFIFRDTNPDGVTAIVGSTWALKPHKVGYYGD